MLSLPNERLHHAQFWFLRLTPLDTIACKHLEAGNLQTALELWGKQDNVSSLQNRLVCALILQDFARAIRYAESLYPRYSADFITAILGSTVGIRAQDLGLSFIESLSTELDGGALLGYITRREWKVGLTARIVQPIVDRILEAVEAAKEQGNDGEKQLTMAYKLMRETHPLLRQLAQIIGTADPQYQMAADKLGLQILQCSIIYYNNSNGADAARTVLPIQEFALSVVVGTMAKERCQENVRILKKVISSLPPQEVAEEYNAILQAMAHYSTQRATVENGRGLIQDTLPHLQAMRAKVGEQNTHYLKLSTLVAQIALSNLITQINEAQKPDPYGLPMYDPYSPGYSSGYSPGYKEHIKSIVRTAWEVILMIDGFDLEAEFRSYYATNRTTLQDLCQLIGVSTSRPKPQSAPPKPASSRPQATTTTQRSSPARSGPTNGTQQAEATSTTQYYAPTNNTSRSVTSGKQGKTPRNKGNAGCAQGILAFLLLILLSVIIFFLVNNCSHEEHSCYESGYSRSPKISEERFQMELARMNVIWNMYDAARKTAAEFGDSQFKSAPDNPSDKEEAAQRYLESIQDNSKRLRRFYLHLTNLITKIGDDAITDAFNQAVREASGRVANKYGDLQYNWAPNTDPVERLKLYNAALQRYTKSIKNNPEKLCKFNRYFQEEIAKSINFYVYE